MSECGSIYELLSPAVTGYEGTLIYLKKQAFRNLLKIVDDERKVLIGGWVSGMGNATREHDVLQKALTEGTKPSAYAEKELRWVWEKGFVPAEYWPVLLEAMDRVLEQPYATGWARRSYRSAAYGVYTDRVISILQDFVKDVLLPFRLTNLLTGNVPKTVTEFMSKMGFYSATALVARIASALDRNNKQVEQAIRNMIEGDTKPFFMREVI